MKQLAFLGSSLDDLADFPADARRASGYESRQVQRGLMPSDFKPLFTVGPGAYENRVHVLGDWCVVYAARFEQSVYVLHAFQKKSRKTRKEDIDLARERYKNIKEKL